MSFRLTYGTMFNPPEAMHERFETALATVQGRLGEVHPLFIDGHDREACGLEQKRSPIGSAASRSPSRATSRRLSTRQTQHFHAGARFLCTSARPRCAASRT